MGNDIPVTELLALWQATFSKEIERLDKLCSINAETTAALSEEVLNKEKQLCDNMDTKMKEISKDISTHLNSFEKNISDSITGVEDKIDTAKDRVADIRLIVDRHSIYIKIMMVVLGILLAVGESSIQKLIAKIISYL